MTDTLANEWTHTAPWLVPAPLTKQQVLEAAAGWRKNADEQDAIADYDTAQGLPRGDVSSFRARAKLWRQVAEGMEAEAEGME